MPTDAETQFPPYVRATRAGQRDSKCLRDLRSDGLDRLVGGDGN